MDSDTEVTGVGWPDVVSVTKSPEIAGNGPFLGVHISKSERIRKAPQDFWFCQRPMLCAAEFKS